MTRQRLAHRPNRSSSRTWVRAMRFCQVSTPAHSSAFSTSATVLRAHSALPAMVFVGGEAAAAPGVVEVPDQRLQDAQERSGDRVTVLAWPALGGGPGPIIGHDAGLGIAVQGNSTPGAEDFLAADHASLAGERFSR
jgi:hypothetical protein